MSKHLAVTKSERNELHAALDELLDKPEQAHTQYEARTFTRKDLRKKIHCRIELDYQPYMPPIEDAN